MLKSKFIQAAEPLEGGVLEPQNENVGEQPKRTRGRPKGKVVETQKPSKKRVTKGRDHPFASLSLLKGEIKLLNLTISELVYNASEMHQNIMRMENDNAFLRQTLAAIKRQLVGINNRETMLKNMMERLISEVHARINTMQEEQQNDL